MDDQTDDDSTQCIDPDAGGFSSADDTASGDGGDDSGCGDDGSSDDGCDDDSSSDDGYGDSYDDGSTDEDSGDDGSSDDGTGDPGDGGSSDYINGCGNGQPDSTDGPRVDQQAVDASHRAVVGDVVGMIPGVGTLYSGVQTYSDLLNAADAAMDGNWSSAGDHLAHGVVDGVGMVPFAGTVMSGAAALWDLNAGSEREQGATAAEAPTFTDAAAQAAKFMYSYSFGDPSYQPAPGPAWGTDGVPSSGSQGTGGVPSR